MTIRKKLLWASGLLVLIFVTILFLTARYAGRVIEPFVRSFLEENKPLNHQVKFGRLEVNLIKSIIDIRDLRVYPDSSLVKSENVWWDFTVPTVKLTDFSLWDFLFNKKLSIGDFLFLNPKVEIHFPILKPDKVREVTAVLSPKKIKPAAFKSFSLEKILISKGTLKIFRDTVLLANSPDISFIAQQLSLEKSAGDKQFILKYGDVRLNISDINLNPESSLYEIKLGKFTLNRSDSTIILERLKVTPLYDKVEFSKKLSHQDDRIDLNINRITIIHLGFERWLNGQPLEISKAMIDSLDADIYRDRNVAMDPKRFPLYYNELFLKINFPMLIDTLSVVNSTILYGELAEGDPKAGEITLNDFNLSTYGLSDQVPDIPPPDEMRIFLNAKVMGEGTLKVELALPLKGNLHDFKCTGSVGATKLSPLNHMMGPSMNMNFKDGKVTRMTFDFTANDKNSKGWMEFLYKGLDVSLLSKDQTRKKGFLSKLFNSLMLTDNPAPGKDLITVEIGYERDKNKGIINYMWKTLQSGMTRTIMQQKKYEINRKK